MSAASSELLDGSTALPARHAVNVKETPVSWLLLQADGIFMSPPWGGPDYKKADGGCYNVEKPFPGLPVGLTGLIAAAREGLRTVAFSSEGVAVKEGMLQIYLPKNSDRAQIQATKPKDGQLKIVPSVLPAGKAGVLKAITVVVEF